MIELVSIAMKDDILSSAGFLTCSSREIVRDSLSSNTTHTTDSDSAGNAAEETGAYYLSFSSDTTRFFPHIKQCIIWSPSVVGEAAGFLRWCVFLAFFSRSDPNWPKKS